MFILNAGLSHKSKDWLMSSSMEIKRTKRGPNLEKRYWCSPNWTLFGNWVISRVLDVQMTSKFYTDLVRHRSTTFIFHQDLRRPFASLNYSNNGEIWICPAARILFSVWPISGVLEVQITSIFFSWKAESNSYNFHVFKWTQFWC